MTTTTDHAWFAEHLGAAVTGGLSPADRARFDAHAAICPECADMLHQLTAADAACLALFPDARPAAGLEDRVIQRLRNAPPPRLMLPPVIRQALTGLAAAV